MILKINLLHLESPVFLLVLLDVFHPEATSFLNGAHTPMMAKELPSASIQ
ncbi:hypothetical protein F11_01320 [Rhodospirillum rubrum F11]|nr:hypothetical protein F11_01320 [Rhodospirillum rubrum F11]